MPFIESYPLFDFSSGIRRNASAFGLRKNELWDARNVDVSEIGRVKVRKGSHQVGDTLTGTIENSAVFAPAPAGGTQTSIFMVNNNASSAVVNKLLSPGRLATALTTASTSVVLDSGNGTSALSGSGTIEIEGDLIAYTSKNVDGVTLDGISGITSSHAAGAAVHQWQIIVQSGTSLDGQMGITYPTLNNLCFLVGRLANIKYMDSSGTISDVSNPAAVLFGTNYRDRIYGAGDGSAATNGTPTRVSFSNRGDGTTWTTGTDYFDVPDQRGENITGFRVLNDALGIFKSNSIFTYDEVQLKQQLLTVGAYNHKVTQEINGLIYTFCPAGIFATNLYQAKNIGEPVRQFFQNFRPQYDATGLHRVVVNTFASAHNGHYQLFIGDITDPTSNSSVILDYDTVNKSWVVYHGIANNFRHLNHFDDFRFGDYPITTHPALFGGDTSGKFWRLYDNIYIDRDGSYHGGDLRTDSVSNTGSQISAYVETPLYDFTHPELYKIGGRLRVFVETGEWKVSYRYEDEDGVSEYKPLGTAGHGSRVLPFPKDCRGWRIGLRFSTTSTSHLPVLNGFVFEHTEVVSRK